MYLKTLALYLSHNFIGTLARESDDPPTCTSVQQQAPIRNLQSNIQVLTAEVLPKESKSSATDSGPVAGDREKGAVSSNKDRLPWNVVVGRGRGAKEEDSASQEQCC